jgi:hypothetical protein
MFKGGGASARATSTDPKAATGLKISGERLVAFLDTASRDAAAITIFYRLYGER